MSFLGRPSQLGESEKDRRLVARGTKVSDASASLPVAHRKILLRHQLDRSPYYFSKFQQEQLKYREYFQQTFDLCEREKPEEGGGRCVQAGPDLYVG